jgi:hypothetical protein
LSDSVEDVIAACFCLRWFDEPIIWTNAKEFFESFWWRGLNWPVDKLQLRGVIRTKFLDQRSFRKVSAMIIKR